MTIIQTIQSQIITQYQAITLPNSLGAPTGYKHEPINGFDASDLPAVVVTRGIALSRTPLSSDRDFVVREFITDLYTYIYDEGDAANATNRDNTSDCISAIEAGFNIHGIQDAMFHEINADTGDTELYARDNETNYIGVRFRHQVTYIEEK